MVLAIFVFAPIGLPAWYWLVLSRILGIPLIAGLSYEVIKWAGRNRRKRWVRALMWPGLMLQNLTTREPDREQLAVAIAALEAVLAVENPDRGGRGPGRDRDRRLAPSAGRARYSQLVTAPLPAPCSQSSVPLPPSSSSSPVAAARACRRRSTPLSLSSPEPPSSCSPGPVLAVAVEAGRRRCRRSSWSARGLAPVARSCRCGRCRRRPRAALPPISSSLPGPGDQHVVPARGGRRGSRRRGRPRSRSSPL